MDGSRLTAAHSGAPRTARWLVGPARRREQLRLFCDPELRAAANKVVVLRDPSADAFQALYLRYAPYVASIGARLLGCEDELDQLVREVFLQVLRGLDQLREPATFKGWLAQITIRGAVRQLRKRCLSRALTTAPELWCNHTATPERRMLSRDVYTRLDGLPPKSRVIWILRHVQGEPLHVIAQRIGCSLSTVQRRLSDAQSSLEERFLQDFAV